MIRLDVFNAIKKLLKIQDYEHTKTFIHKILEKEMLHDGASGRSRPHFD